MRWGDLRGSSNVEDRRGMGGGGGMRMGGLGIGGLLIVGLLSWATGIDPRLIMGGLDMVQGGGQQQQQQAGREGTPTDEVGRFVSSVLGSTEDVWTDIFQQNGQTYQKPRLVLFTGATQTACGQGQSAMGPFYCPPDKRVYLDTSFFREMEQRFRAPGDFASAYVVAHEIGHHVQNLLGIMDKVNEQRERGSRSQANALSVRLELQADCLAGVWAARANQQGLLEAGDVEEALAAATAIGDDRIQKQTQGQVVPDSFTHGSSAQRVRWFRTGLEQGTVRGCNTFAVQNL
ncbi:KPN_02809 family neutral zinc metallopeptidase [Terrihabitans rhizophilus]|jgi:predicted metalloprotease|uniref:Neutral zinc metallopeptidase n=1 Tax=Terrihabitans rhizophilus TaxID=3092662 RepID=A0ABU4RWS6_9HYPH|nr:neutral zinc metallopeptidase [Terrihabitans sp. PJ23]MDX6807346.1 neutral zinc metallopeptidase [Terrihabitans sp. PJ23]